MKKKIFWLFMIVMVMFYATNVLAVDITGCKSVLPDAKIDVKIANTVHLIITLIKIAVPIILVIFGMIDLFKGITSQKEDEIKKNQQIFVKRLIAAAIIFFVIAIVQFLISLVSSGDEDKQGIADCVNCFLNGANASSGSCK